MKVANPTFSTELFTGKLSSILERTRRKFLMDAVPDNSKWHRISFENRVRIKTGRDCLLICLAIWSWELPLEYGMIIRLSIEEKIGDNFDKWYIRNLLYSKSGCHEFIRISKKWSSRDFYGNILNPRNLNKMNQIIEPVCKTNKKPKRSIRHRGYRDKGTIRPLHEHHSYWECSFAEEIEQEEELAALQDALELSRGFLSG